MDLFEALVRLDAAGWRTEPPAADDQDGLPPELARLLRRTSALVRPDGQRFGFTGGDLPPGWLAPDAPVRRALGAGVALVGGERGLWVLRHGGPSEDVQVLAGSIAGWLELQLRPPAAPESLEAAPLVDLDAAGDGWGWRLDPDAAPLRLRRAELPEALRDAPLGLDGTLAWVGDRIVRVAEPAVGAPVDAPAAEAAGVDLDEVFGEGGGRPRPRSARILTLLVVGVVLTVLGMSCVAVPGGLLVLLAWMWVEKDVERLESGYLPEADRGVVERTRSLTYAGLLLVVALFVLQALLLCGGFYDVLLDEFYIPWWRSLFTAE